MLRAYNALFIIPDDHVAPLKNYLKNLSKERDFLKNLATKKSLNDKQKKRLSNLNSYNLESKIHRIKDGGISFSGLENLMDRGITQIKQDLEKSKKSKK